LGSPVAEISHFSQPCPWLFPATTDGLYQYTLSGTIEPTLRSALRLYQATGTVTTRFAYDGQALIAEYDGSNVPQRRYVQGPGADEPLVWYEGSGTSDRRWLHADERGSINGIEKTHARRQRGDNDGTVAEDGRACLRGKKQRTVVGAHAYRERRDSSRTGMVERIRLGSIEVRILKVVVSPALGNLDVLGMNFLSQLASWRVQDGTLMLVPSTAQAC